MESLSYGTADDAFLNDPSSLIWRGGRSPWFSVVRHRSHQPHRITKGTRGKSVSSSFITSGLVCGLTWVSRCR